MEDPLLQEFTGKRQKLVFTALMTREVVSYEEIYAQFSNPDQTRNFINRLLLMKCVRRGENGLIYVPPNDRELLKTHDKLFEITRGN